MRTGSIVVDPIDRLHLANSTIALLGSAVIKQDWAAAIEECGFLRAVLRELEGACEARRSERKQE